LAWSDLTIGMVTTPEGGDQLAKIREEFRRWAESLEVSAHLATVLFRGKNPHDN